METYFRPKVFNTNPLKRCACKPRRRALSKLRLPALLSIALLVQSLSAVAANATTLQPYNAVYTTRYKGMSAEAIQSLTSDANGRFTLTRNVDSMFVKLHEQSEFQLHDNNFIVSRYTYERGGLASKKKIEQLFQWDKGNLHVTEKAKVAM